MDATTDHRSMDRFPLELTARLFIGEVMEEAEELEVQTKNICGGGAFFKADRILDLGAKVSIELVLSLDDLQKVTGNNALIRVSGTIVRASEEGMAVCFNHDYEIRSLK